jgi:hypothetical protein
MNLDYNDKRKNAAEVLELKIFLKAGDQFLKSLYASEEEITMMGDNHIAELGKIYQKILMELEGRTTNMIIECLSRFFPNFDQVFNRANDHSREILEKLNAQEAMRGSLLTKSGEEIKNVVDSQRLKDFGSQWEKKSVLGRIIWPKS